MELAIPPGHPQAVAAAEQVLAWLASPQHRRTIRVVDGLVRQHATQEGYGLAVCCRLGMARGPPGRDAGGLPAGVAVAGRGLELRSPGGRCPLVVPREHRAAVGLAEYARATGNQAAGEAAERAAELLLAHRLFRSHRTGQVTHEEWLRLHYPPYWHYDVLHGLLMLSRCGKAPDPRAAEALDLTTPSAARTGAGGPTAVATGARPARRAATWRPWTGAGVAQTRWSR